MPSLSSLSDAAIAVEFSSSAVAFIVSGDLSVERSFSSKRAGSSGLQISVEAYGSPNAFLFSSSVAVPIHHPLCSLHFASSGYRTTGYTPPGYSMTRGTSPPPGAAVRIPGEGLDTPGSPA